jgi:hypothetical protein
MVLVAVTQVTVLLQDLLVLEVEALTDQEVRVVEPMVVLEQHKGQVAEAQADQDMAQAVQVGVMVQVYHQVVVAVEQDLLVAVGEDVGLGATEVVAVVVTGMDFVQSLDIQKLDQDALQEIQAIVIEDQPV